MKHRLVDDDFLAIARHPSEATTGRPAPQPDSIRHRRSRQHLVNQILQLLIRLLW